MEFHLAKSISILKSTPEVVAALLYPLSEDRASINEGENTWSLKEVVAHLIVCEKTNWMVRAKIMLSQDERTMLVPIDIDPQFELAREHSLRDLLAEFARRRKNSLQELKQFRIEDADLKKTAVHPTLGTVNLQQLIATWVTHDLSHIVQISRILAKDNREHVGPFAEYLRILKS